MNDSDNGAKGESVDPFIYKMAGRKLELDSLTVEHQQVPPGPFSHGVSVMGTNSKGRSR